MGASSCQLTDIECIKGNEKLLADLSTCVKASCSVKQALSMCCPACSLFIFWGCADGSSCKPVSSELVAGAGPRCDVGRDAYLFDHGVVRAGGVSPQIGRATATARGSVGLGRLGHNLVHGRIAVLVLVTHVSRLTDCSCSSSLSLFVHSCVGSVCDVSPEPSTNMYSQRD